MTETRDIGEPDSTKLQLETLADKLMASNCGFDDASTTRISYDIATGDGTRAPGICDEGDTVSTVDPSTGIISSLAVRYDDFEVRVVDSSMLALQWRLHGTIVADAVFEMLAPRNWQGTIARITVYNGDSKPQTLDEWYSDYIDRQIAIDLEAGELDF